MTGPNRNLLTEEEAAGTWCRHARVYSGEGAYNREVDPTAADDTKWAGFPDQACCIGSLCAAWVWGTTDPSRGCCADKLKIS